MENMVRVEAGEGRAGSILIAKGFNRRHDQVVRLIRKYSDLFEKLSPLKVSLIKTKGTPFREYLLTEGQFLFLGTLFKNSDQVVEFKFKLVKEFEKCRDLLAKALNQKQNAEWQEARINGKRNRSLATDAIQEFVEYAKAQGGTPAGCDMYYSNITKMTNALLFICEGNFKNLRNVLTSSQLMIIGGAEMAINKALRDGMKAKLFYKDIYKDVKEKAKTYASLYDKTEVISKQIMALP